MRVLITGGLGFIGSAVIRKAIAETDHEIINIDKISYASTSGSVESVQNSSRYQFMRCDITDKKALMEIFTTVKPDAVLHLAAESHVDRSIDGPEVFVQSNIIGTFNLLEAARDYDLQKFIHVSTDEVFGSLNLDDQQFHESTPYNPRSPYSATKAASDHLARAWGETFEVPVTVTNCSNNYGPYQFPEKLIPLTIIKAISGETLPVYGTGENIRDWLFVDDHAEALLNVLDAGEAGETYLIGGDNERTNLELVKTLCKIIDDRKLNQQYASQIVDKGNTEDLIQFVIDRPGHDLRYAINSDHIQTKLGWKPTIVPEVGLEQTVDWYLENAEWWKPLLKEQHATERIGVKN